MSWRNLFLKKTSPLLQLRQQDGGYRLWNPSTQTEIELSELGSLTGTSFDIQLGLDSHQVLTIAPLEGLSLSEYPLYWKNTFQQLFPDQVWDIVLPDAVIHQTALITARPYEVAVALKPFDKSIRWCRPAWAVGFFHAQRQLTALQRAGLSIWIWEEHHQFLWLERSLATQQWKKAVIRYFPEEISDKNNYLQEYVAQHCDEQQLASILHVRVQNNPSHQHITLHHYSLDGKKLVTSAPDVWRPTL
ncbi:MAG: hypothetical protein V4525_08060 [Pseudomonadota bacterium]